MGAEKNGKDVGFSKKNLGPPTPGLVSFFIINIKLYINSHTLLLLSLLFDSIHSAQDIYENVCMTIKMVAVVIKVSLNQFVRLGRFFLVKTNSQIRLVQISLCLSRFRILKQEEKLL